MLILQRTEGESIRVNGPATLTIEHVHGRRVKVSIQAPKTTTVLRGELEERKLNEQESE